MRRSAAWVSRPRSPSAFIFLLFERLPLTFPLRRSVCWCEHSQLTCDWKSPSLTEYFSRWTLQLSSLKVAFVPFLFGTSPNCKLPPPAARRGTHYGEPFANPLLQRLARPAVSSSLASPGSMSSRSRCGCSWGLTHLHLRSRLTHSHDQQPFH